MGRWARGDGLLAKWQWLGVPIAHSLDPSPVSHIKKLDVERVVLNELAAGGDFVAHEEGEERVGLGGVLDIHFQQAALVGIHRRFEELLRVHFAEALVALDAEAFAAVGADLGDDVEGAEEPGLVFSLRTGVLGPSCSAPSQRG